MFAMFFEQKPAVVNMDPRAQLILNQEKLLQALAESSSLEKQGALSNLMKAYAELTELCCKRLAAIADPLIFSEHAEFERQQIELLHRSASAHVQAVLQQQIPAPTGRYSNSALDKATAAKLNKANTGLYLILFATGLVLFPQLVAVAGYLFMGALAPKDPKYLAGLALLSVAASVFPAMTSLALVVAALGYSAVRKHQGSAALGLAQLDSLMHWAQQRLQSHYQALLSLDIKEMLGQAMAMAPVLLSAWLLPNLAFLSAVAATGLVLGLAFNASIASKMTLIETAALNYRCDKLWAKQAELVNLAKAFVPETEAAAERLDVNPFAVDGISAITAQIHTARPTLFQAPKTKGMPAAKSVQVEDRPFNPFAI